VGIGAPLRWENPHALMKLAFGSPALASRLRVSGTRRLAKLVLPLIAERYPAALSMYMNTSIVNLSRADELVKTVEDPIPKLNGEIARWLKSGDLMVAGINVTKSLERVDRPYLAIIANRDGIVTPESAKSALDVVSRSEVLEIGDAKTWFAHADLFISRYAEERVFEPLARWLRDRRDD
jgi:alpha-beta hydrolase superfamily lysophospholipase